MKPSLNFDTSPLSLEREINQRLGEFDLIALLRLLKHEGFQEQDIWFSSHNSLSSQNRVIESVTLYEHSEFTNSAFIELNLGLLASTGILPAHIRQFMDRPDVNEQSLQTFFQFYDHILIANYLGQVYPEINKIYFESWQHTKKCYTELQNMRSESSLHWLFERAFPEFYISLTRIPWASNTAQRLPVLGSSSLGQYREQANQNTQHTQCVKIIMTQRPHMGKSLEDCTLVVRQRVNEWVFPWLNALSMSLEICLRLSHSNKHLKLIDYSSLGYDPFYRSAQGLEQRDQMMPMQTITIHQGPIEPIFEPLNTEECNAEQQENQNIVWEDTCRIHI
ncbi:hypothetical protein [Teredinibacter franksiae]|uniref:hypothetical protein n=1 Tax=Teredinibacter franksiae TaxID=2761453 RepID=UPI001623CDE6|nr:hypothetical protein [Teredinibacter franksiae]